ARAARDLGPMQRLEAGGASVALRTWGDSGSPPLLFWHGAGDTGAQFERAGRTLATEADLFVVAPDAPGHGDTPPLGDDDYRPSRLGALAAALLDALGLEKVVFAGFSWGGSVGCHFAADFPRRTRALALIEGGHIDFRDVVEYEPPSSREAAVAAHGLEGALHWGSLQEPAAATYTALCAAGTPVLLVTTGRGSGLVVDPVARLRAD